MAASERPPRRRLRPSRPISPRDLATEALAAVLQRPLRSALTALGTVLGVGAFVATIGLTTTTEAQVGERFDVLKATEVTVQDTIQDPSAPFPFPADAERRLRRLNGVRGAGLLWSVDVGDAKVGSSWEGGDDLALDVTAASPGALDVLDARAGPGRTFDEFANGRRERVVLLGKAAARELGIADLSAQPAVLVGGLPFTVIGIVDDLARRLELLRSVVVPAQTALAVWRKSFAEAPAMVIETDPGAAQLIGRQAPLALRPERPEALLSLVPPEPRELRRGVESDLGGLLVALAAVSLLIGAVGIANTTLVSVLERTGEIGLRRALGATAPGIAGQFLAESAIVGALGGVLGACVGVVAVSVISTAREWSVVVDPLAVLAAPAIGLATGLLAGLYPAVKAARVEPIAALRS
jgi:putative ABC transport system permease protein